MPTKKTATTLHNTVSTMRLPRSTNNKGTKLPNRDGGALMASARDQNDGALMASARKAANKLIRKHGFATIDDVFFAMQRSGLAVENLGHRLGSVFRDSNLFRSNGDWKKSIRASNHQRKVRVWISAEVR